MSDMYTTLTVSQIAHNTHIGATAYLKLEKYEECLQDANEAIGIKPDFVKGLLRKAQAERELLLCDDSLKTVSSALELDPENDAVKSLYEECKSEWDDDNAVSEDNPEKQRFNKLEKWLKDGGSQYDKLKIRFYNPIYRGVHAATRIKVTFCFIFDYAIKNFSYLTNSQHIGG